MDNLVKSLNLCDNILSFIKDKFVLDGKLDDSLFSNHRLLDNKIELSSNELCNLYGCQLYPNNLIKILSCKIKEDYHILLSGKNFYYVLSSNNKYRFSADGKEWVDCNLYLASVLLSCMELINQTNSSWGKIIDYDNDYNILVSYLKVYGI